MMHNVTGENSFMKTPPANREGDGGWPEKAL